MIANQFLMTDAVHQSKHRENYTHYIEDNARVKFKIALSKGILSRLLPPDADDGKSADQSLVGQSGRFALIFPPTSAAMSALGGLGAGTSLRSLRNKNGRCGTNALPNLRAAAV